MSLANDAIDAAVELEDPPPDRLGPYRIVGVLGRGGMGLVYRGAHARSGEPAAIKTVLARSEPMLASIRREIHALSLLRHPGVVRIVDTGMSNGLPWYAMELLSGVTMRSYVRSLWTSWTQATMPMQAQLTTVEMVTTGVVESGPAGPPQGHAGSTRSRSVACQGQPLEPTLTLVRRLCEPLAYLHGEGIVHLDLKPENIFIENNGTPVLVDLGIASQFRGEGGRDVLETRSALLGSCAYMAPEQIRGELVDARADLYALGCILYECLTGGPPFRGTVSAMLRQHLNDVPVPPSMVVQNVPEPLERLVMNLLAKRPAARVGYASDVAAALAEAGAAPWNGPPPPRSKVYLYRPAFAGREEPMEKLQRALERARSGEGRLVFIGGESGAGKTRLAMEAARTAARRGMLVIAGQCVRLGADAQDMKAAPLHPFRPLLAAIVERCRAMGAAETEHLLGTRGRSLATYEPALAELPGQSELPEPPPLGVRAARARLLSHLKTTLLALAESTPLLLLIDDLQWADDLSLSLVGELSASDLAGRGALIVGTYRMEERSAKLAEIVASPIATRIELSRLERSAVAAMTGDMLGLATGPRALVDFVARRSDGNPLFVSEHLHAAVEHGMLTRDADGRWRLDMDDEPASFDARVPLPRSLSTLLESRLLLLSPGDRALAEVAAVLGREVEPDVLRAAAGAEEESAMEAIERLRVRQILEDVGGRLRFVHDRLRETIQGSIPEDRSRALHLAAAAAIEARHGDAPDAWPALAHHYVHAQVPGRAAHYLTRAGDRARAAAALGEAATYYRAALREARTAAGDRPSPGELLDLHERLGDVLALAGKQAEARGAFREAVGALPPERRIDGSRLHRKIGKTHETAHAHQEALAAYADAEAWLGEPPPSAAEMEAYRLEWVRIRIDRILAHYWTGRVDAMEPLIEEVRREIEGGGLAAERAQFFDALLHIGLRRERFAPSDATLEYARSALDASLASGDSATEGWARFMLVFTLLFHGAASDSSSRAPAEAEEQARIGIAKAERAGDVILLARYHTYLVLALRLGGRVEDTRAAAQRALSLAASTGMLDYVAAARASLAWAELREGHLEDAERLANEARSGWDALAVTYPFQWAALFPSLCCALDRGDEAAAASLAAALLDERQARLPDEIAGALDAGLRAARDGLPDEARGRFAEAVAAARARGMA